MEHSVPWMFTPVQIWVSTITGRQASPAVSEDRSSLPIVTTPTPGNHTPAFHPDPWQPRACLPPPRPRQPRACPPQPQTLAATRLSFATPTSGSHAPVLPHYSYVFPRRSHNRVLQCVAESSGTCRTPLRLMRMRASVRRHLFCIRVSTFVFSLFFFFFSSAVWMDQFFSPPVEGYLGCS